MAALDLSKSSIQSSIGPSTLHLAPRRTKSTKPKQASLSLLFLGAGLCASSSNVPAISLNEYPSKRRRVHHRLSPPLSLTNLFLPLHIIQVADWPCWPCLLSGRVGRWDNVRVPIVSPRPPAPENLHHRSPPAQISSSSPPSSSSSSMRPLPGWPTPLPPSTLQALRTSRIHHLFAFSCNKLPLSSSPQAPIPFSRDTASLPVK